MRREFRCKTRKQNRKFQELPLKDISRLKTNSENIPAYEKLSFMDIQHITRSMIQDPKAFERSMGVISSIKGKMYCLKLGEVDSSKDFSNFFYSKQYRQRQRKDEPLKKMSSNSMYSQFSKELSF